ncbi:MAG TPA: hypothetical protein VF988_15070, partial [Verrucomicrobiae bacterium]
CFALASAAFFFWWRVEGRRWQLGLALRKTINRFKRPAPFLFSLLALLSLVSGLLYAPYNSDTYAYRVPRVLHWLGQEQWHWIHTADMRMNIAGCDYEWLATPLILFTHTDRWLFCLNWIPYLLLPGLIFCALRSAGVRPRVSWWWAWILASGWCYVMQAASVVNDSFALVYALAAVVLAVKSGESNRPADFWISFLAVALLTGVKQVNLPLVPLWAVAAIPQWRQATAKPLMAAAAILAGVLVSAVPLVISNLHFVGSWSGTAAIAAEYPDWRIELDSPVWGVIGNAFCLPLQNLAPPFFPWSKVWNRHMDDFVHTSLGSHFKSFEHFGGLSAGISESSAGIGMTVTLLATVSVFLAWRYGKGLARTPVSSWQRALQWLPWLLLVVFMAKVGERENARHLSAYYIFFFPVFLSAAGHSRLVRQGWWQKLALLCLISSIGLLVLNTSRPLVPAESIIARLKAARPESKPLAVLQGAYAMPAVLEKVERQLKAALPPDELLFGYAATGNAKLESALWLPLGQQRVVRVTFNDQPETLATNGIHYVIIENAPSWRCLNMDDW